MLIEPAEVPVIRGRGTEEDGWRQIVSANLAEFIHFSQSTWLDGNTIPWRGKREQGQSCCEGAHAPGEMPAGGDTHLPGIQGPLDKLNPLVLPQKTQDATQNMTSTLLQTGLACPFTNHGTSQSTPQLHNHFPAWETQNQSHL